MVLKEALSGIAGGSATLYASIEFLKNSWGNMYPASDPRVYGPYTTDAVIGPMLIAGGIVIFLPLFIGYLSSKIPETISKHKSSYNK